MLDAFADELAAHRYLEALVWPAGPVCPHCGERGRIGKLDGQSTRIGAHKCYACRKIFSITRGTIFEGSHLPLHKWFQAIYLTDRGVKSVSPCQLARILNVSCKTASSVLSRLAVSGGCLIDAKPVHSADEGAANRRQTVRAAIWVWVGAFAACSREFAALSNSLV
jgi:transposase-like protein